MSSRVGRITAEWSTADIWGAIKCRISSFRMHYSVMPGLYAIGQPDKRSDVFVTANYKLSFDILRKHLRGMNAWILVLDTKGINVWCAAGKKTFGTVELINRICLTNLANIVEHRRLILPQLGASGVCAAGVSKASGFHVSYGPVRAQDIPEYLHAGYQKTEAMRTVRFTFLDRLILTPIELLPAMKKYPLFALIVLVLFGLTPEGILFRNALQGAYPYLLMGLGAILCGALLTPVLLPYIPSRSFAIKGWLAGLLLMIVASFLFHSITSMRWELLAAAWLFFPAASSYLALQFTGASTFTSMSGVKKELKVGVPLYFVSIVLAAFLVVFFKIREWGIA